jgi:hypothetical protein
MDFLYLQRGLESKPCREILYIIVHAYNACAVLCLLSVNPLDKSPPPPPLHDIDNSTFTFTLYFKYFLRILCTFYLSTFCLLYLSRLTQVVLLLITSTFTWVQIQSNLGTTDHTEYSIQGVSKKLKTIEITYCSNLKLNTKMREILTGYIY